MINDPTAPAPGDELDDIPYTLEVIAGLAGVDATTVVYYHEQGFLRPVRAGGGGDLLFDAESLRQLRRIEHLRDTCSVNPAGLRLILSLLDEVEQLRRDCRRMTR